jgi:uncharacterized protein (TIRG00374 family)
VQRPLMRGLTAVVVIVALVVQRHSLLAALGRLGGVSRPLLAVALACEVVSLVATADLQRRLLAGGGVRLSLRSLVALVWASNAVGASLPAGAAASTAYTYRHLTSRGTTGTLAGWLLTATGILSGAALALIVVVGLQLRGLLSACTLEDVVEVAGLTGAAAAPVALLAWVSARPGRLRRVERCVRRVRTRIGHVVHLRSSPTSERADSTVAPITLRWAQWIVALSLAATNWVADGAVLAVCLLAVGEGLPWRGLVFAYAVSQLSTILPVLPGAIGVAEGSLFLVLVCVGVAPANALAATLLYRLASFWLQLPAGWAAWAYLRRAPA